MSNGWREYVMKFLMELAMKAAPIIIEAILNWLREITEEEAIATGRKAALAANSFREEYNKKAA